MRKERGIWKRVVLVLLCVGIVGGGLVLGINTHIKKSAGTRIISQDEAAGLTDVDCILVLGCGVREDGTIDACPELGWESFNVVRRMSILTGVRVKALGPQKRFDPKSCLEQLLKE